MNTKDALQLLREYPGIADDKLLYEWVKSVDLFLASKDKVRELLHSLHFEKYELVDGELIVYDAKGVSYVQREFKIGSPTYEMFEELYDIVSEED